MVGTVGQGKRRERRTREERRGVRTIEKLLPRGGNAVHSGCFDLVTERIIQRSAEQRIFLR